MMIFSSTSATCLRLLRQKLSRSVLLSSSYNLKNDNVTFPSRILQATPKCYNSSSTGSPAPPDPSTFTEEQKGTKESELRIRRYKKIFSTVLFATTLIAVAFARRRRRNELEENFQGCVRIPTDESFKGSHKEFFRCGVDAAAGKAGCVLPAQILKDGTVKAVKAFKVRPDDVYVASFPKTGTTWVQEIVYLLKNNLDFAKASGKVLEDRFPYLEYPYPGIHSVEKMTSPRLIKTHLPLDFLPQDILSSKVIYITRNPKDTVVSYYHFARMLAFSSFEGSFAHFFKKFLKDELPYTPFFGHIESYTKAAENPNLLIITYEQLTREPAEIIKKIADFLDVPVTAEDISSLVTHTSFQSMEKNPSVNYSHWDELGIRKQQEAPFMRKGKVGDWKNYFSSEMNEDFDAWINANNKAGFQFNYEL